MSSKELDGVIEAVRYDSDGMVKTVRLYERRGPIFSDRIIISRDELIKRLKAGKKIAVGTRELYLAGTFQNIKAVQLIAGEKVELVTTAGQAQDRDDLEQAPLF